MSKMKTRINKHIAALFILLLTTVCVLSCKDESPYYNVENKLQQFDGNALAYLQANAPTYDSLLKVLERLPDLKDTLQNQQVTLFAPTNENFISALKTLNFYRKQEGKTLLNLGNADLTELETMACKYIVKKQYLTDDFKAFLEGIYVRSVIVGEQMHIEYGKENASGYVGGGAQIVRYSDTKEGFVRTYWDRTQTAAVNIKTKNAVIYVLSPIHNFGFNEFTARLNK
ncbi:MAG: hypothetical protein EOO42_01480 [Flavobacteriales bacterium]|nr:MAG: hypothetical protein EOO42_01480 [Flavobacteriales bacterium]